MYDDQQQPTEVIVSDHNTLADQTQISMHGHHLKNGGCNHWLQLVAVDRSSDKWLLHKYYDVR